MLEQPSFRETLRSLTTNHDAVFDLMQAALFDGMWHWNAQNNTYALDATFWQTLGYDEHEVPQRPDAWQAVMHPDDWQATLEQAHAHCADPTQPYDQVVRFQHKDGSTVWLRSRGVAIRDEHGQPLHMVGAYSNVTSFKEAEHKDSEHNNATHRDTERTEAQARAQKSTPWYDTILENQKAYIIKTDTESNYTYANRLFLERFNLDPDTYLGTSSMDSIFIDDHPKALATVRACFEQPYQAFSVTLRKPMAAGIFKASEWDFMALTDDAGNISEILCVGIDVTQQLETERALKASEAQFRFIAENTSDGIVVFAGDQVTYASPAYERMLGYSLEELQQRNQQNAYWLIHPDDRDYFIATLEHTMRQQHRDVTIEYRAQCQDGRYIWREDHMTLLYEDRNLPAQTIVVARDISERKQAEGDLQRTTTLLEDAQRIANMGGWELDVATNEVILTKQVYAIHELPLDVPVDKTLGISFYHPEDQPIIADALEQAIKQQQPFDVQCRFITAKGNHRWVRSSGYPVLENGQVTRLIGMFQDITEQKEAELALRESENRYRLLADNSRDLISLRQLDHTLIYASPAYERLFGYNHGELALLSPETLLHPDDLEHFRAIYQVLLRDHTPQAMQYRLKKKDGTYVWIEVYVSIITDGVSGEQRILASSRDITDRKQAEDALRESEAQHRTLFENMMHEVHLWELVRDEQGAIQTWRLTEANPAALKAWGKTRAEIIGKTANDIFAYDATQQFMPIVEKIFAEGTPHTWEAYVAPMNQFLYMTSVPFGEYFMSTGIDISDRKRAEDALRKSEAQLELFFSQSLTGFFFMMLDEPIAWHDDVDKDALLEYVLDHDRITKANQAFADQYKGNVLGRTLRGFFPHDPEMGKALWRELFDRGHWHVEVENDDLRPDDTPHIIEGDYICLYDDQGRITGHFGVQQDISDRKKADRALAESEAKFRSYVENASDAIFTLSPEGMLLYTSPQWETVKGFSSEGLVGTSFVPLIHPDDIPAAFDALQTVVKSKKPYNGFVYRSKHGDGTWHWFSANSAPIFDETGNVNAILTTSRDITSNKLAEQAMHTTLERLETTISQNNLLMKEIHHRVKNNLAVISALLALRASGLHDAVAKEALQESRQRIKVMAEIHELMYSHDSSGTIAFDAYLQALTNRMQRSFSRDDHHIRVTLESSGVELSLDQAIPLGLIINELLSNATKYAFPQDYPDPHIAIAVRADSELVIEVADNGVGVEDVGLLEVSDSLGMTVVHSLTEQLLGDITFTNRPRSGIGLQVTLRLPLADTQSI
jgi:PAS domain S-box-containing protein